VLGDYKLGRLELGEVEGVKRRIYRAVAAC